jgi:hypothetical protein
MEVRLRNRQGEDPNGPLSGENLPAAVFFVAIKAVKYLLLWL